MSIWMGYPWVAVAATSAFLLARWWYTRTDAALACRTPSDSFRTSSQSAVQPPLADAASAAQTALERVGHLMARQFVGVDVAIPPGLVTRMRQPVLAEVLEEMLTGAIQAAPASRLLLTGLRQGDYIEIVIIDDMPGADLAYRQGRIRDLSERIALQGGTLEVTVQPAEGTTTVLRLLASEEPSMDPIASASPYPARSPAENSTL